LRDFFFWAFLFCFSPFFARHLSFFLFPLLPLTKVIPPPLFPCKFSAHFPGVHGLTKIISFLQRQFLADPHTPRIPCISGYIFRPAHHDPAFFLLFHPLFTPFPPIDMSTILKGHVSPLPNRSRTLPAPPPFFCRERFFCGGPDSEPLFFPHTVLSLLPPPPFFFCFSPSAGTITHETIRPLHLLQVAPKSSYLGLFPLPSSSIHCHPPWFRSNSELFFSSQCPYKNPLQVTFFS